MANTVKMPLQQNEHCIRNLVFQMYVKLRGLEEGEKTTYEGWSKM